MRRSDPPSEGLIRPQCQASRSSRSLGTSTTSGMMGVPSKASILDSYIARWPLIQAQASGACAPRDRRSLMGSGTSPSATNRAKPRGRADTATATWRSAPRHRAPACRRKGSAIQMSLPSAAGLSSGSNEAPGEQVHVGIDRGSSQPFVVCSEMNSQNLTASRPRGVAFESSSSCLRGDANSGLNDQLPWLPMNKAVAPRVAGTAAYLFHPDRVVGRKARPPSPAGEVGRGVQRPAARSCGQVRCQTDRDTAEQASGPRADRLPPGPAPKAAVRREAATTPSRAPGNPLPATQRRGRSNPAPGQQKGRSGPAGLHSRPYAKPRSERPRNSATAGVPARLPTSGQSLDDQLVVPSLCRFG